MCECYDCIHNNGDGYCKDNSYIIIMEDGICSLMEKAGVNPQSEVEE